MTERLDDRIKELCSKAISTPPSPELEEILQELQKALHEHALRMRKMVADYPVRPERRSRDKE